MYSIWLLPAEKESKRFQKIINTLSESFKTPAFEPHITLMTSIPELTDDLFYQISVLAALTNTFDLSIEQINSSSEYFKSLFVEIRNNDSLHQLHQEITNLFHDIEYDFQPHVSLLYGEVEAETKQSKIEFCKENLISLFPITKIAIVHTQGDVKTWRIIESFDFHQAQNPHLDFVFDTVKNLKI